MFCVGTFGDRDRRERLRTTGFRVLMVVNTSAMLRQHMECIQTRMKKRNLLPSGKKDGRLRGATVKALRTRSPRPSEVTPTRF